MRRILMLAATLAIPVSGAALALTGTQAWAKAPKINGKVTCTTISGNVAAVTVSGCTDKGSANTGSSTETFSGTTLAEGGTITWINGTTVTFGAPTLVSTSAKHCPVSGSSAEKLSGSVTASTSGLKIPGTYKGEVCISPGEDLSAPKPLKVK